MEQTQYLIDTNAIIDYLGNKLPASGMAWMSHIIDDIPNISVISKIEVLGFNASDEHYEIISCFINDCCIIDMSDNVVEKCIEIRKNYKIKLPDAIIASTALAQNMVLITRNISDFKNIQRLKVVNPHEV
ncbi:MAG: type II toxin-antitoxin system VapC family toxin [Prolixibacteraceae bacterium]|jgi:predicted nucleic acid-binding protein|nr:type II toxin-antitoxin system VapC family toxin [Prolixibacteraceae bacterium]